MILDVGCGSGFFQDSSEIKNRGSVNVDILRPKKKIVNFVLCDVAFLPFRSDFFEKVFFIDVIEHVSSPELALRELKRVSKKYVFVGTPNAIYFKKILRCFVKGNYGTYFDHVQTFGIPELSNMFERVGLVSDLVLVNNYRKPESFVYRFVARIFPYSMRGRQILCRCVKC